MPANAPSPLRLVPPPDRPDTEIAREPEALAALDPGRLSVREAIEPFVARLVASGRSPRTIDAYRGDLEMVVDVMVARSPGLRLAGLTAQHLDATLADPRISRTAAGAPRSPARLHRIKAAILSFCSWATTAGVLAENPARSIKLGRLPRKPPAFLAEAERRRLLKELAGRTSPRDRRDRVIIEVFLNTGIRLTELVNLDVDDVDLDAKHLRIKRAKGGGAQVKFLKTGLRSLLRAYLAERRRFASADSRALFVTSGNVRISARQVQTRVHHWLRKAGIAKKLGPHALRHSFATHLYAATSNILLVQRALGHRDVSTTEVYTHLVDGALEDALERL